jgi:hypothetical protein
MPQPLPLRLFSALPLDADEPDEDDPVQAARAVKGLFPLVSKPPRLVEAGELGGPAAPLSGSLIVLGETPAILALIRGTVWTHELHAPDRNSRGGRGIACAAPLHSPSCEHGVLVLSRAGRMQACSLAPPPAKALATRRVGDHFDVARRNRRRASAKSH